MVTVGVVSPGAMGAALGLGWREAGARVVVTLAGRSPRTHRLAEGLEALPSLDHVVLAADVVISIVPPGEAVRVAGLIGRASARTGASPLVADLNAVAPSTLLRIEQELGGLHLVDGAISGGPPYRGGSRLYLSGRRAGEIAALQHARLEVRLLGGCLGAASAVKMSTASVYKGIAALFLHAVVTADAGGVLEEVVDDLSRTFPDQCADLGRWLAVSGGKSERYVSEMREIATAQGAAGLPADLFDAMALVWSRVARSALGSGAAESPGVGRSVRQVIAGLQTQSQTGVAPEA